MICGLRLLAVVNVVLQDAGIVPGLGGARSAGCSRLSLRGSATKARAC